MAVSNVDTLHSRIVLRELKDTTDDTLPTGMRNVAVATKMLSTGKASNQHAHQVKQSGRKPSHLNRVHIYNRFEGPVRAVEQQQSAIDACTRKYGMGVFRFDNNKNTRYQPVTDIARLACFAADDAAPR